MAATTVRTYRCSVCCKPIKGKTKLVEIGEYGLRFHVRCFLNTTGPRMVRLMGCDETLVRSIDENGATIQPSLRVRQPDNITETGSVRGEQETVTWE